MAGKGMTPIKGYNHEAFRDRFPFPERKTSQQWCDHLNLFLLDQAGWPEGSWGERITEAEFGERVKKSSVMHRTEEPGIKESGLDTGSQG